MANFESEMKPHIPEKNLIQTQNCFLKRKLYKLNYLFMCSNKSLYCYLIYWNHFKSKIKNK